MGKAFRGVKLMKFSILVPVYNVQEYLEQCIDSLLFQTYDGDYEIILVDDGSTDLSGQICDKYAEEFPDSIKVIHKENGGHTSARLEAIKNAIGDYCVFCDSDDFIENNLLSELSEILEQDPLIDLFIYGYNYYKNGQKTKKKDSVKTKPTIYADLNKNDLYSIFFQSNALNTLWTKAVKTSILKNDQTDYSKIKKFVMGEDLFVSIYLVTVASRILWLDKCLYNYRILNSSITRSFSPDMIRQKNTLFIYERFLEYLPKWNMDDEAHRNQLKNRWLNETIYTFSKFYEAAKNNSERKAIVDFDWNSFLPDDFSIDDLKNADANSVKIYKKLEEKDYAFLRSYFLKKAMYKKCKELKARIKGL